MDNNKKLALDNKPDNVVFTGFVSYGDYVSLLRHVDAVIVLTNRDKTMLSGAFEALAVGKPLITSNWNCLMQYYSKGAICIDNSTAQIKEAIQTVQRKKSTVGKRDDSTQGRKGKRMGSEVLPPERKHIKQVGSHIKGK